MQIFFVENKPNQSIKVCSDKSKCKSCDMFIDNFVHIMNAAISFNSMVFKNQNNRVVVFDIECLRKGIICGFLNRVLQSLYEFNKYKTVSKKEFIIRIYAPQLKAQEKKSILEVLQYANYTRDLLNEPANKSIPASFSENVVKVMAVYKNVNIQILDSEEIKKQGLGLIDAIGSSSSHGGRLLIIEYIPKNSKKTLCLVGKGVTIDTGGYALKGLENMYNMHMDKTGASICIGLIKNLVDSNYRHKVVAVIPLVENVVSDIAVKPGDVVQAYNGQTVEIVDSDAEGRLILADALSYACKHYNPDYIMDFATLTGWSQMIHCHTSFTFFTLNEKLAHMVSSIGDEYAEKSFRIPSWTEYSAYLVSDKADIKNFGYKCINSDGFMASIFLLNFIPTKYRNNWIHFDIRITSFINSLGLADGFGSYLNLIKLLQ